MSIEITKQPPHGHVSINPNGTLAFVGGNDDYTGPVQFEYIIKHSDGSVEEKRAEYEITPSPQHDGWGTGETFYMLPVGPDGRVIVEHGDNHRKVYVSGDGLTASDIAAREGVDESEVDKNWLEDRPHYGASEEMALHHEIGLNLWWQVTHWRAGATSNWLLLERGYEYPAEDKFLDDQIFTRQTRGESPLHPTFIGAWGTGERPKITGKPNYRQAIARNVVVQDVDLTSGFKMTGQMENMLIDNVTLGDGWLVQGTEGLDDPIRGVTVRNAILKDAWRESPASDTTGTNFEGRWNPFDNRSSGAFVRGTVGLLLEGVVFDSVAYAPDFAPDGSIEGGHPPSMYSHNIYLQDDTRDVTMRNSISMRSASFGAQFRGGAHVQGNLFLDNNISFTTLGGDYKNRGPVGNYSLIDGNVTTIAARLSGDVPHSGAQDWGVLNEALLTSMVENIVAHANDPDDPEDTATAQLAVDNRKPPFFDDTIVYRWAMGKWGDGGTESNTEGLDPAVMDATTIQRYTAALLGQDTATVDDFGDYLGTLDSADYAAATHDVLSYFRAGFGVLETSREDPADLRFVPDPRGDGVRWDNRFNWDRGDLPGTADGDSVDLGGNKVVFAALTTRIEDLVFGKYGCLIVNSGRLTVEGEVASDASNTLRVGNSAQVWLTKAGSMPDAAVTSGRIAATSNITLPGVVNAEGWHSQVILATGGTECVVAGTLLKDFRARVGVDGTTGAATVTFADTATLRLAASHGQHFRPIGKYRSGAYGDNAALSSKVNLGGSLIVDMLNYSGGATTLTLIDADQITGEFDKVEVLHVPEGLTASVTQDETTVNLSIT